MASTTLKPNGSSKSMRCRSACAPPSVAGTIGGADRAEIADVLAVEVWLDLVAEVLVDPG